MIKVEIWSDYVCPFCYIGKKEFENAVEKIGLKGQVNVINRAFLLDPTTPLDTQELMVENLQKKYGMPMEQVKEMCDKVTDRAASVGLTYNFDTMKNANTLYAHKLVKWAATFGKEHALNERLLKAFFIEGAAIGDIDVLTTLASEIGLDPNGVMDALADSTYSLQIEEDVTKAQEIGARGVPLFLIEDTNVVSGAQPLATFEEILLKIANEKGITPKKYTTIATGETCSDDSCDM